MTRTRLLSLAVISLLAAGLVLGCGGGGGDEDPQQVIDETFSNDQRVTSGVIDLSLGLSAEGAEGGSLDASLNGPFQADETEKGKFPQLDLTVNLDAEGQGESIDFEGGLITTSDAAFVTYQDTDYEVPQQLFNQLQRGARQAAKQGESNDQDGGAVLDQIGIDASGWLTNLENEGDEDVEGTNTIHIHGDANVPQILEDLQSAIERTGGDAGAEIDTAEIEDAVEEASVDVYSGKDDRILRRLDLNLTIAPREDSGAEVDSVDVGFSLTLSDVNEEQTIDAPSDAQPFEQLLQDLGIPPSLLEGALRGGGGGRSFDLGGGGGGGGIEAAPGTDSEEYLDCIAEAQTPEELQACEP